MDFFSALILGVVEGLTEFLPISSTAHLDLARQLLGLTSSDFVKSFEIAIQLGAILAVAVLYWKKLAANLLPNLQKLLVAFLPTGILGLIFYKIVKTYLLGNNLLAAAALILGGVVLIFFKTKPRTVAPDSLAAISYKQALAIGCCQALAMIPGISRAGATIIGGLALGVEKSAMVEFSFLLAIPTMLAAVIFDLTKTASLFSGGELLNLGVGFAVSFVVAWAAVKFFLNYIKNHDFKWFGFYRIIIGLIILWLVLP